MQFEGDEAGSGDANNRSRVQKTRDRDAGEWAESGQWEGKGKARGRLGRGPAAEEPEATSQAWRYPPLHRGRGSAGPSSMGQRWSRNRQPNRKSSRLISLLFVELPLGFTTR